MSDSEMSDSEISDSEFSDSEKFRSIGSQTDEECSNGKSEKNAGSHRKSGGPPPPISFLRYFFLYYLKGKRYVYSV
mgnify:CR=1 FL=1